MLDVGRPVSGTDTPAASAFSVNVPSPLLRNRKFGTASLVTKMSRRPSWSKSANDDAHALADVRLQAGARRHVFERAVAAIAVEAVRQPLEDARVAVDVDPPRLVSAGRILVRRPLHVIDDQEIEAAVVVVVEPAAADGEVAAGDARGLRDVLESPVAAIAIELIGAHAGDEQIDVAVVVEVACRCPDRVAGAGEAGR